MSNTVTLAQIRTRAKERANMENSAFVSASEWLSYINGSYAELYDILVSNYEDYYISSTTFTISSGNTQSLPTDFYKLRGVDYQLDANNWIALRKFNFADRNQNQASIYPFQSNNIRYRILGNNLLFEPIDDVNGTYKLYYVPIYTPLSADADTVNGIQAWDEYIVVDAAIKALNKEETDVSVLMAEKQALLQRIQAMSSNRDVDQPERISDVNTMGYLSNRLF